MTIATRITILRILLIPVFVAFVSYYGASLEEGAPRHGLRTLAIATFIAAALSDALDGWIARRFNQRSRLGRILDPIADKGLMLAAILALTLSHWPVRIPIWFAILVFTKEAVTVGGAFVIHHVAGNVAIRPHVAGKVSTFLQMLAVSWVMVADVLPASLQPERLASILIAAAALAAIVATVVYIVDGVRQLSLPHVRHEL